MSKEEKEKKYPDRKKLTKDEIQELRVKWISSAKVNDILIAKKQKKIKEEEGKW